MGIHYAKDEHNVVTLTLDQPGRAVNVVDAKFGVTLAMIVERLQAEANLAGVIITSAKKTFMAGGDLTWLYAATNAADIFHSAETVKAGFRHLETLGVPVVAALNGTALGSGIELALACHHRIVVNDSRIRLGFPGVTLGLLPGGGGVTRLTRLLGLQAAFPLLTEGAQLEPTAAHQAGLVDALANDTVDMLTQARAWIVANPNAVQPWDRPGYRMPGGDPRSPRVAQMLSVAPAMLRKRTYGNYPAPEAILSTMVEGAQSDFATASRIESRYFAQLATGQVAKNMINAFWFQLNQIKDGASRPQTVPPQVTKKVGVLGAGMMGHGIAYVTAVAHIDVVLKDETLEKAEAGKAKVAALLAKRVSKGKLTKTESEAVLARIQVTAEAADLADCDLIIEAVYEDRELKAKVVREAEDVLAETAVFASNTSTLPVTSLAKAAQRPHNFVGLHFFSPVEKMKLVEIIRGEATSEETLAKAFDFVLQIDKLPIVVNDSRGFYTSRVFGTYLREGLALLGEGYHPRAIESAGLQAGMPVGPLALADEVSLELMLHIREQTRRDMAAEGRTLPDHPSDAVLDVMTGEYGRYGRAHGAGFYDYPENGNKSRWPELQTIVPSQGEPLGQREMMERLMFVQALEAVRCLEENVVTSVADANVGAILGWGFAPFKGGTLQYINDYGLEAFIQRSQALAEKYGERFAPPAKLLAMREADQSF